MSGPRSGAVAAIDCGTNSTRLLVLGKSDEVLERHMRITRLGEGVDATRMLAPEAIDRTVAALRDYRAMMDAHRVGAARLVATSATRDARNAHEFFEAAEKVTGLSPELLRGEEEGLLSFVGATAHLPGRWRADGAMLVVDIGGGSTELVVGRPGVTGASVSPVSADGVRAVSLDIGCVRVSERFFRHDPPRPDELGEARTFVDAVLSRARDALPAPCAGGPVIGLAGTVSTLAALEAGAAAYERAVVHHSTLTRTQVDGWLETLAGEGAAARLRRPGIVAGRQDVIVGGVLVLAEVMALFDRSVCVVSEDDILDGLAASVKWA